MDEQSENPYQGNPPYTIKIPGANTILILGILSIGSCWCWGIPGLVFSIIALRLGRQATKMYADEPAKYRIASYQNLEAGKVCAIIGLALSIVYLLVAVLFGHFIHSHFPKIHF